MQTALGAAASSPLSFGYSRWDGELELHYVLVGEMKGRLCAGIEPQASGLNFNNVALTSGRNLAFVAVVIARR